MSFIDFYGCKDSISKEESTVGYGNVGISFSEEFAMHPLPHLYTVRATSDPIGQVQLTASGLAQR